MSRLKVLTSFNIELDFEITEFTITIFFLRVVIGTCVGSVVVVCGCLFAIVVIGDIICEQKKISGPSQK